MATAKRTLAANRPAFLARENQGYQAAAEISSVAKDPQFGKD
jgi:hypothetical protein